MILSRLRPAVTLRTTGAPTAALRLLEQADEMYTGWLKSDRHPSLLAVLQELNQTAMLANNREAVQSSAARILGACIDVGRADFAAGEAKRAATMLAAAVHLFGVLAPAAEDEAVDFVTSTPEVQAEWPDKVETEEALAAMEEVTQRNTIELNVRSRSARYL